MFLVSSSRWKQRFLASLTIASAVSLQTTHIILDFYGQGHKNIVKDGVTDKTEHAVIWYLALILAHGFATFLGFIISIIPANWRGVPWLDNKLTDEHVDDKDDKWRSFRELAIHERATMERATAPKIPTREKTVKEFVRESTMAWRSLSRNLKRANTFEKRIKTYKELTCFGFILHMVLRLVYIASYITSIYMSMFAFFYLKPMIDLEALTCIIGLFCNILISGFLLILVFLRSIKNPHQPTPYLSRIYVPMTLSCSCRLILDINELNIETKHYYGYIYIGLISSYMILHTICNLTQFWVTKAPVTFFFVKFFKFNFYKSKGAYKKFVRVFDTLGTCLGLFGLVFGIFSLLCDQYDIEFELKEGSELKKMKNDFDSFLGDMKDVVIELNELIDKLNFKVTCSNIYDVIGGGTLLGILASFVPGMKLPRVNYYSRSWRCRKCFN